MGSKELTPPCKSKTLTGENRGSADGRAKPMPVLSGDDAGLARKAVAVATWTSINRAPKQ